MNRALPQEQREARLKMLKLVAAHLCGGRVSPSVLAEILKPYSPTGSLSTQAVHNVLQDRSPVPSWYLEAAQDILWKRIAEARALHRALWLASERLGIGPYGR